VDFTNSHAIYPTLTTANASAIATGHYLGDTGDYANTLSFGFPIQCALGEPATVTFLEDDCVLRAVKGHFGDGYMGQTTLMQAARAAGYNTLIVGKKGPAAIQWLGALDSEDDDVNGPLGIFVDDATNRPKNADGTPTMSSTLHGDIANDTIGAAGSPMPALTTAPNWSQQAYLISMTTQVLIPNLHNSGKPFVMLFWSRDPDATQHAAPDSLGKIVPGINSTNARAAIYNADTDLKGILDALKLWGMADNTDVFVTADHGFSTIARGIPAPDGSLPASRLAFGFVALDVAKWLGNQNVFDPDQNNMQLDVDSGQRPAIGSAFIGPSAAAPKAIVVANGGSDLIYVPDGPDKRAIAKTIVAGLLGSPYTGAVFVNDALSQGGNPSDFAGALALSDVNMVGSATVPRPDIVLSFRSFVAKGCTLGALMCTAEIADTNLQTGQGMHGSFSRADTRNFMAAIGPDFKAGWADPAPIGNFDIAPTMAHILGLQMAPVGHLTGRVIAEALKGGKTPVVSKKRLSASPGPGGVQTVLDEQIVGGTRYFDAAGIPGRAVGLAGH
jgi:arylsulfatase A-like enzyme